MPNKQYQLVSKSRDGKFVTLQPTNDSLTVEQKTELKRNPSAYRHKVPASTIIDKQFGFISQRLQKAASESSQVLLDAAVADLERKLQRDKLQSTIPRDRYSHLSPRGERIERLVGLMAAGFEQFVNLAGAKNSGVPLASQPPSPVHPWNQAYADATRQNSSKQLSQYQGN